VQVFTAVIIPVGDGNRWTRVIRHPRWNYSN